MTKHLGYKRIIKVLCNISQDKYRAFALCCVFLCFTIDIIVPPYHSIVIGTNSQPTSSALDSNVGFSHILNHWGRVTHICTDNQTINGSDNGLSPGRRQAIIWTNAGILFIGPLAARETKSSSTFTATNSSSNMICLLQLQDTIQMKSNYTRIDCNLDTYSKIVHVIHYFAWCW